MSESRTFTVTITPDIVRGAARAFVWKFFGWTGVLTVVAGSGLVAWFWWTGSFDWLGGFLAATLLVFVVVFGAALLLRERMAVGMLRKMGDPRVHYELSEESFTARSRIGSTTVRWEAMKGIWRFPRFWLLFLDRASYVTLPLEGPSAEDLAFLAAKIPRLDQPIK
jgi:hypothetical protein